ncbi:MAG: HD domain-containing protein [Deltaproteobacteria bacterium]|nr:HD domain-containing protein [Deltaproteobacteria bacterium]
MKLIDLAIEIAAKAHGNQVRKGTDIPYVTHPFAVGVILLKAGCVDEVVVAGILHDTVEDTSITLDYIRETFGEKVASIVEGCSEPDKSLSWEDRKKHTIEYLKTAPLEVRLVACADKLHNIGTIATEYARNGDRVWKRFKKGKADQEGYYRSLVESLCNKSDNQGYESLFQKLKDEVEGFFGRM